MPANRLSETTGFGPRRFYCAAVACNEKVDRTTAAAMFCQKHWLLIPSDVQTILHRTFRREHWNLQKWTARFERAMDQAIAEVWSVQVSGQRIPKERDFEW